MYSIKKGSVMFGLVQGVKYTLISTSFLKKKYSLAHWGQGGFWGCRGQGGCKGCWGQKITRYINPKYFFIFLRSKNDRGHRGHGGHHGWWGHWGQWIHQSHLGTQVHGPDDLCHAILWLEKYIIIDESFLLKMASCRNEAAEDRPYFFFKKVFA